MTKEEFHAKAVRAAERDIRVPPGWWGTYRNVTNGRVRVTFARADYAWVVRVKEHGSLKWRVVSRHGSRSFAIGKARKL